LIFQSRLLFVFKQSFLFFFFWKQGDTIELIRELLKKRADEMPVVRVAVRHGWKFMDYGVSITFLEVVHFLPYYDAYFKHQMMEKLQITNSGDKLGFDPAIFM